MKPGLTFGLLLAVALTTCYALPSPSPVRVVEAGGLELTLVHVNDMHARYEQTSAFSGACSERDAQAGACYGGHARVATVIKQTRQQEPNVLVLNAGDTYQGTVYYSVFKWNISAEFVNLLNFDAITLGNHEFDDHTEGLVPFVERINKNLVLANADFSGEPKLAALNIKKSIIVERAGVKIGIIGYLTPETAFLASVDNVSFSDEVIAVKAEAAELKKKGVDIIIGLGHSGYERDKTIAAEVPDIDLVVGGHSHTFLYSGTPPDSDVPMGLYPTWITQPSGRKVPVLQAYAFTKYIGRLKLKFDDNGELISLQGGPILLNKDVAEDPETLAAVGLWKRDLDSQIEQALGITRVFLDGASCRRQECNLGNLVADAFIYGRAEFLRLNTQWTDASVALVNGGSIRTSINATSSGGIIKIRDAMETMPFDNLQVLLKIKGSVLLEALEHSVSEYVPGSAWKGSFLQVSGVRVIYDVSKPSGQRVVSVSVRCDVCTIPAYSPLDKDTVYGVIVNGFLANGGDGFTMFANNEGSVVLQDTDGGTLQHYIQKRGVVYPGLEGRIAFQSGDGPPSPTPSATSTSTSPTTTTRSSTQLPSSTTPASPSSRPTAAVPAWVLLLASLLLATLAR